MVTVIALTDGKHRGDDDNARAVGNALSAYHANARFQELERAAGLRDYILQHPAETFLVVGAGEQHVKPLADLAGISNVTTVWSGHQPGSEQNIEALARIDTVHLPRYAVSHQMKHGALKDVLVTTSFGVPQGKTPESVMEESQKAYESGIMIPEGKHYINVILGGNATDDTGATRYYTEDEAYRLGRYIGAFAMDQDATVLGTSGPRTGQGSEFDTTDKSQSANGISSAFLRGLEEAGLPDEKQAFFPFDKDKPYIVDMIMHAALTHDNSYMFVPGESVTMLSQMTQNMPPGHVVSYHTDAMNLYHEQENQSLRQAGLIHELDLRKAVEHPVELATKPAESVAKLVAEHAMQRYAQRDRNDVLAMAV